MKLFANRTVSVTPFLIAAFGSVLAIAIIIEVRIALITAEENTSELLRDKAEVTLSGIDRVHAILRPWQRKVSLSPAWHARMTTLATISPKHSLTALYRHHRKSSL